MKVEVPLEGLTWGELRAFVRLGAALPDDAEVDIDVTDQFEPEALVIADIDLKQVGPCAHECRSSAEAD